MRSKPLATVLGALALLGVTAAVPAEASAAPSLLGGYRSCVNEVGGPPDFSCYMVYNGSSWYKGDWVAVHVALGDGHAWANGYSARSGQTFQVRVRAANGETAWSAQVWGGRGNGASAGPVNSWSGNPTGTIFFGGGGSLEVYKR